MSDTTQNTRHPATKIHAKPDDLVPRFMVVAMFGLVAAILLMVSLATLSGKPMESTPTASPIIKERSLVLTSEMTGAAKVLDQNGTLIADFTAEKGGFVAGIERVVARERAKVGAPINAPVLLQLREGNRLSLFDPSTGWTAELMGFGADNTRTFARLLD